MTTGRASGARVVWILTRMGVRRWVNMALQHLLKPFARRKSAPAQRTATPRKGGARLLLPGLLAVSMLAGGLGIAFNMLRAIAGQLDMPRVTTEGRIGVGQHNYEQIVQIEADLRKAHARAAQRPAARRDEVRRLQADLELVFKMESLRTGTKEQQQEMSERLKEQYERKGSAGFYARGPHFFVSCWPKRAGPGGMVVAVAAVLAVMGLAVALLNLGSHNQDLGKVDWSMEWLFTLPAPAGAIFAAQILYQTITNAWAWFMAFPLLLIYYWTGGWGAWGVPLAAAMVLYFNLILAAVRVVAETYLRKRFSLARLKNLQAVFTVTGTLGFFGVMALGYARSIPQPLLDGVQGAGRWLSWSPCSAPALLAGGTAPAWSALLVMAAWAGFFGPGAIWACGRLVRNGLIAATGPYQGSRGAVRHGPRPAGVFHGIVGKELRLLLRDRNFFAQTLILPLLVIGFQLFINPGLSAAVGGDPRHAATIAFGVGAYMLMAGGFQVLAAEGKSLWLLYTVPQSIERIMVRKALLWSALASVYTLGALAATARRWTAAGLAGVVDAGMALAGVGIYGFIAAGIGVLGTDPLEESVQRRIRPGMAYVYMLLASFYAFGIYTPSLWQKAAQLILCCLVAYAIWQKVADRAPLLLDPTQKPAPQISLSDGLIAAFAFFVIQGAFVLILMASGGAGLSAGGRLTLAYAVAGLIVTSVAVLTFLNRRVPDLGRTLGLSLKGVSPAALAKAVGAGLLWGALAAAVAALYLQIVEIFPALRAMKDQAQINMETLGFSGAWLAVLAIGAAPIFEEFVFRGLVFGGLSRSFRPAVAVLASAAVFAVVHPAISVVPVFVLGAAAALSFRQTGLLAAPIAAHMLYNAAVIFAQHVL